MIKPILLTAPYPAAALAEAPSEEMLTEVHQAAVVSAKKSSESGSVAYELLMEEAQAAQAKGPFVFDHWDVNPPMTEQPGQKDMPLLLIANAIAMGTLIAIAIYFL